jgi:hypothetical protein
VRKVASLKKDGAGGTGNDYLTVREVPHCSPRRGGRDEVHQNGKAQSRESVWASGDRISTSLFKQKGSTGRASGPKDGSLHVSSFGVLPSPMKSDEFAGLA